MTVKNVLKKHEVKNFGNLVINAAEAKDLIKSERLPDNWISLALTAIDESIKFQAESKSNHTAIWDCTVRYHNTDGTFVIIPVKDNDKIVSVKSILESRGYEVECHSGGFTPGWSMEIKW